MDHVASRVRRSRLGAANLQCSLLTFSKVRLSVCLDTRVEKQELEDKKRTEEQNKSLRDNTLQTRCSEGREEEAKEGFCVCKRVYSVGYFSQLGKKEKKKRENKRERKIENEMVRQHENMKNMEDHWSGSWDGERWADAMESTFIESNSCYTCAPQMFLHVFFLEVLQTVALQHM